MNYLKHQILMHITDTGELDGGLAEVLKNSLIGGKGLILR